MLGKLQIETHIFYKDFVKLFRIFFLFPTQYTVKLAQSWFWKCMSLIQNSQM